MQAMVLGYSGASNFGVGMIQLIGKIIEVEDSSPYANFPYKGHGYYWKREWLDFNLDGKTKIFDLE